MGNILCMDYATFCACPAGQLITTADVAAIAGVDVATVNRWATAGALKVEATAKGRVYRVGVVRRFLAARDAKAAS